MQVKYIGRLKSNNKVFDQTKGNKTFSFRLGVGEVIKVRAHVRGSGHDECKASGSRVGRLRTEF